MGWLSSQPTNHGKFAKGPGENPVLSPFSDLLSPISATYLPTGLSMMDDGSVLVVGYGGGGLPTTGDARQGIFFGGSADGFILVMK